MHAYFHTVMRIKRENIDVAKIRHLFISLLQNLLTKACEVPEGIENQRTNVEFIVLKSRLSIICP